jgi:hypothetical protein
MCPNAPIFPIILKSCGRPVSPLRLLGNLLLMMLPIFATPLIAQSAHQKALGIAWDVRGTWNVEDKSTPIRTGDAVTPGTLLLPDVSAGDHSITVLLPDGRRILYECFTAQQCARGFRVPTLYREPDPFAVQMMGRIHAVLVRHRQQSDGSSRPAMPRDEAVAVLGAGNRIEVRGLAAALENGHYTYDVRPINVAHSAQIALSAGKKGSSVAMIVPGEGLFRVTIADSLKRPRIDLFVDAIDSARVDGAGKSFERAHALLLDWDEDYQGWPIHDFQRAYLESLELGILPTEAETAAQTTAPRPDAVPEPHFTPLPGVFKGDTEVTLQCDAAGAVIHYTVDGSEPFNNSPAYRAPIMVKGTELTIKAFAVMPDKKDSPVVTGIFLIEH